jgi:hypothetical protein
MISPSRFDKHARLLHRMAAALDVNLAGRLDPPQMREMLVACTRCASPGACEGFLAEEESSGEAAAAPSYCRNRETLNRLAALR